MTAAIVERLLEEGRSQQPLPFTAYEDAEFDPASARAAAERIASEPTADKLVLALALRRAAPETYTQLPTKTRAALLVDALRTLNELNDFGWMDESSGYDGPAAQALIELGADAAQALRPLLNDSREAPLEGSEEATIAYDLGYRRQDYAYRYAMRALGRDPLFKPEPQQRDPAIEELRAELNRAESAEP
jgi:hypothetical protein